jgi:hypothetical protein
MENSFASRLCTGTLYLCLECDFYDTNKDASRKHARMYGHCIKGVVVRDFPLTKERVQDIKEQQFAELVVGFSTIGNVLR